MGAYLIRGGERLTGEVNMSGGKNAVLPLLAASLLTRGTVTIKNCPDITDVADMLEILSCIGAEVSREKDTLTVCAREILTCFMPEELSHKIRSSIFLMGSMLARESKACFFSPGGCEIGKRPIDQHIYALGALGADICESDGRIMCSANGLKGGRIRLSYPSVGATENAMLAACLADGVTVIRNAAREPEIVCLAKMLRSMGARIRGEGTQSIFIKGRESLHGTEFSCIPDRIEAGTFLTAAAATRGSITVTGTDAAAYRALTELLKKAGAKIRVYADAVSIEAGRLKAFEIVTAPYPGFPTDMQAQLCALACVSDGVSVISETVFDSRFRHLRELVRAGANIYIKEGSVYITGRETLSPCKMCAHDLRGGAALVIAALCADGESRVEGTQYTDRGYERFENKLSLLGADITRV